jgi:hypothetical protein
MEIQIEKLNEILNKNFRDAGYNCDEEQGRRLWLATRQTISEILRELKVDIIFILFVRYVMNILVIVYHPNQTLF